MWRGRAGVSICPSSESAGDMLGSIEPARVCRASEHLHEQSQLYPQRVEPVLLGWQRGCYWRQGAIAGLRLHVGTGENIWQYTCFRCWTQNLYLRRSHFWNKAILWMFKNAQSIKVMILQVFLPPLALLSYCRCGPSYWLFKSMVSLPRGGQPLTRSSQTVNI